MAMVEAAPSKLLGFIVDSEDPTGVFICEKGGTIYGKSDGITDEWTLHLHRMHGLPSNPPGGLFTDSFTAECGLDMRRIARGQGLVDTNEHHSLFGTIDPHDLRQGDVGNCWLISAFSAAAEFPKVVKSLIKQQALSLDGRYDVRLFHPTKEAWMHIVVDDAFPVKSGSLRYAGIGPDGEVWPCVVEKALAKLFGGYRALEGNHSILALKTLTGAKEAALLSIDREDDGTWGCYQPIIEGLDADDLSLVPAPWPDGYGAGDKCRALDDELFALIEDLDETGCIMCCSAASPQAHHKGQLKKSQGHSGEMIHNDGIVLDHEYTLLRAVDDVEGTGFDLIEMRNPWGKGEWQGKWSDKSKMWRKYPQVKQALRPEEKDDGRFWISKEDFAAHFDSISVSLSVDMLARMREKLRAAKARAPKKKVTKRMAAPSRPKAPFVSENPPTAWHNLMRSYTLVNEAVTRFAEAGAGGAGGAKQADAARVLMRQASIFRPRNVPSRLAPLSSFVPQSSFVPPPKAAVGFEAALQQRMLPAAGPFSAVRAPRLIHQHGSVVHRPQIWSNPVKLATSQSLPGLGVERRVFL